MLTPQYAKLIHNNFKKKFIKTNIINYKNYIQYNNKQNTRNTDKIKNENKNYIIQNKNIYHFKFNK